MTKRLVHTSDDLPQNHWMARQLPPGTSLRAYAEDQAISVLISAVQDAINDAKISRAEIARLLGTTKSYVSQVLNGSPNLTVKSLGALLWAAGREVSELRTVAVGAEMRREPAAAMVVTMMNSTKPEHGDILPRALQYDEPGWMQPGKDIGKKKPPQ